VSKFDLVKENYANSNDNKLITFQFLTELNNIFFVNSKGDLYLLDVHQDQNVDGVGSISDGLTVAQWSPDQELLVLITSN
jgi:hypothetical protein